MGCFKNLADNFNQRVIVTYTKSLVGMEQKQKEIKNPGKSGVLFFSC